MIGEIQIGARTARHEASTSRIDRHPCAVRERERAGQCLIRRDRGGDRRRRN